MLCKDTEYYTTKALYWASQTPSLPSFVSCSNESLSVASVCFNTCFSCTFLCPFCHSFPFAACQLYVRNNLSSHWQDAWVPLLVPETQSLRNSQIRWFCSDRFSSLAQTFAVNWSRGSGIQTELCGLELHGVSWENVSSSLLCVSCFISLYIFFALTVWAMTFYMGCPLKRVRRGNLG